MITAYQSDRLKTLNALLEARENLCTIISLPCITNEQCTLVCRLRDEIDGLFAKIEKPK